MGMLGYSLIPRLIMLFFFLALSLLHSAFSREALVLIGGNYEPGYMDNEVEVWSPSSDCVLDISETANYFGRDPGVAYLENQLYVCGETNYHGHIEHICDIFDLNDGQWKEGPSLPTPTQYLKMAATGNTLVAVGGSFQGSFLANMSIETLERGSDTWQETFPYPGHPSHYYSVDDLIAFNEKEVGIKFQTEAGTFLSVFNVVKNEIIITKEFQNCRYPFMYMDRYTCVQDDNGEHKLLSIVEMSEDYEDMTWDLVGSIPPEIWGVEMYLQRIVQEVDGLLTVVVPYKGLVFYLEGEEWKDGGELDVKRFHVGHIVVPCSA